MVSSMSFYERCVELDAFDGGGENLSDDLKGCELVIGKCKRSTLYSQNLYAALCNNSFVKNGVKWSCLWRSSADLVSKLRGEGDYLDWYCSGIPVGWNLPAKDGHVGEGVLTEEVGADFGSLGWRLFA